jgi:AAA family ATP:ADP antiporter
VPHRGLAQKGSAAANRKDGFANRQNRSGVSEVARVQVAHVAPTVALSTRPEPCSGKDVTSAHSEAASQRNLRLPSGSIVAIVASAAMIAQQVAGKATRDALFLSHFSVKTLPAMMGVSAIASLAAALWLSRMMLRHSPAKVVPVGFGASAVVLLATWGLSFSTPRLAALLLYLDTSLFGAAMISAFWSLINETFDPHASRRAVTAIAGGGTLGGLLGGLAAWRMSSVIAVSTMLPLLSAASLLSMWGSLRLRPRDGAPAAALKRAAGTSAGGTLADLTLTPLRVLRGAPYLRNLAVIVALGAVTSGLLDYVFSAEATRTFSKGPALLSFFACFWLVVGILSFLLQVLFGKLALEKLGIAFTVALLPAVVVFGGAVGLAVPGLWSTSILRGGEATQRNSLFRAAYEMLYTPLSEEKKRSTKTLIDVGFDRIGTVAAAGIALLALVVADARAEVILLVIAIASAIVTLARSRALHRGYVAVLEESLRKEASKTGGAAASLAVMPEERVEIRDQIVQHLDVRPHAARVAADGLAAATYDASMLAIAELRSGDPERARAVLSGEAPLAPLVVPFAVLLLADKEFHADAIRALRKSVRRTTGQLVDALCDEDSAFDVRRRVPRVLSECWTQEAVDGLIRGSGDARFEVRYACARALLKITGHAPTIVIASEKVFALVKTEVTISKDHLDSQQEPEPDEEEDEPPALVDRLLRDRIDRSLEHMFTLLALHLDRQSLRLAFKALHESDERVRGTALEYLETVLPDEVRDAVWPFLGEERPMRPPRSPLAILADLRSTSEPVALAPASVPVRTIAAGA